MIKTGAEIWSEIKDISKNPATTIKELSEQCFDKRIFQKWVSLEWLKKEIKKKVEADRYDYSNYQLGYQEAFDYILKLLEG